MPLPSYPVLFHKPITSLGGPFDNIPVPALAQEVDGLDYECELVVVIGKEAREVPESKALDYVMGYAVGDDVSHREWQLKRGGGQWALGKGFGMLCILSKTSYSDLILSPETCSSDVSRGSLVFLKREILTPKSLRWLGSIWTRYCVECFGQRSSSPQDIDKA